MANTANSFSCQIQLLMDSEVDFPQKLKQHLVFKSDQLSNPFNFIGALFSKGVLCDESNESEANFGLKEMMVRLAMMIACAKGAEGIGGLMEALEESGNSQLISDFRAWIKQDFGTEVENNFREPKEDGSATQTKKSEVFAAQSRKVKETSSCGAKLVDKIMSRLEDDFMRQLEGHFVSMAAEIVNTPEFCSILVHQKVLEDTGSQLATGRQVPIEMVIEAACSKKAIGSLVIALQRSNNERIIADAYRWLETSPVRPTNSSVTAKSVPRQQRCCATGLFAVTADGLISLDLRTLKATTLTSERAFAVAVNHKLKKVYWSQGKNNSSTVRANFDGTAEEVIVPRTGDQIFSLAIDEASGNVYYARLFAHDIRVCNAIGQNFDVVICNSALIEYPLDIALDSENGFVYWANRRYFSPHFLVRAKLNGSNATKISTGFSDLYGITLDQHSNDVLYWADFKENTIGSVDVNGGNKRILVDMHGRPGPFGIQVDAQKIYFSSGSNVQSVDRYSGKELTTIFNFTGAVEHLALFNAPTKKPKKFK